MAARHPLFVANGTTGVTPPKEARQALAGLLSGPGIMSGTQGNVTGSTSGPNMQYLVPAMTFATQRGTLSVDGLYLWVNDGVYTADSGAPAPASGSRYDVIYALARNANDGFGDANSDTIIAVQVGTASSTPSVPAVPAGALALAQALIPAGAANAAAAGVTITQVAALTGARAAVSDTGWVTITNISSAYTASVAQCRVKNGELQVRGAWTRNSSPVTVGEAVFGIPAGMFPTLTSLYRIPFVSNGTVSGFLSLSTAGIASVAQVSGATTVIVPATTSIPID
jgi:hypothetical protein